VAIEDHLAGQPGQRASSARLLEPASCDLAMCWWLTRLRRRGRRCLLPLPRSSPTRVASSAIAQWLHASTASQLSLVPETRLRYSRTARAVGGARIGHGQRDSRSRTLFGIRLQDRAFQQLGVRVPGHADR
jgi:hypothetical protein